jgi:hypothetical protein
MEQGMNSGQKVGAVALCIRCPNVKLSNGDDSNVNFKCPAQLTRGAVYDTKGRVIGRINPSNLGI